MSPSKDTAAPLLLLLKWHLVGQALVLPSLSAGDIAVLWQLCDRFNEQAGAAWPSLSRLAADTGRSRYNVQRSLRKLKGAGLVEVLSAGTRTASSRYRPAFEVGTSTCPQGRHAEVPTGRHAGVPEVGTPACPESIYEPDHKGGFMNEGDPVPADAGPGGAAGTTPQAATPGTPNTGRRFPAFWTHYPKGTEVFKTENAIQGFVSTGVPLTDIVEGARRYGTWVKAQPWGNDAKYIVGALKWVQSRRWLDDFSIAPKVPAKAPPRPASATNPAAGTKGAKSRPEPASAPPLRLVLSTGTREQELIRKQFLRIEHSMGLRAEKDRCAERIRREFPEHAAWITWTRSAPAGRWPPTTETQEAAMLQVLKEEYRLIADRVNARARAAKARRAAS